MFAKNFFFFFFSKKVLVSFSHLNSPGTNNFTLPAEPFFCLLDFGVLEKGSA